MGKSHTSKTKRRMSSSRSLPEEIIHDILSWLPVKSIARFRCVSKYWCNDLFKSQHFIKLHLEHAVQMNNFNLLVSNFGADESDPTETFLCSIDHTVLSSQSRRFQSRQFLGHVVGINFRNTITAVLGSCNGLVCIHLYDEDEIFIWNPCTKEYKQVPETPYDFPLDAEEGMEHTKVYGFGYDSEIQDYKLVKIVGFDGCPVSEARVYTLGSNTWRNLGFIPYDFSCGSVGKGEGCLLNGALHWIVSVPQTENDPFGVVAGLLVSFNICNETFHDIPLPNNYPKKPSLGLWEGKLCVLHQNHVEDRQICKHHGDHVDVWTMNDNIWSELPSITAQLTDLHYRRPFQTLPNGEILFTGRPNGLISYDAKLKRARVLKIHGFPESFDVETFIGTLVSVNSGTYVAQQQGSEEADDD